MIWKSQVGINDSFKLRHENQIFVKKSIIMLYNIPVFSLSVYGSWSTKCNYNTDHYLFFI